MNKVIKTVGMGLLCAHVTNSWAQFFIGAIGEDSYHHARVRVEAEGAARVVAMTNDEANRAYDPPNGWNHFFSGNPAGIFLRGYARARLDAERESTVRENTLYERHQHILTTTITDNRDRIEELKQTLAEREREIAGLKARLEEAEKWRSFIETTLNQREANHTPVRQRGDFANDTLSAEVISSPRRAQSPGRRVQIQAPSAEQ